MCRDALLPTVGRLLYIVKVFVDDLTVCSQGVSDGTYDAYLHFDPTPALPDLRSIDMQIVSGIPIWVAGDTSTTSVISTTTTSTTQPCPSEVIYGDYSEETQLMRNFRDEVLNQSAIGQELIKLYYRWSPAITQEMEEDEEFKDDVKELIDGILMLIMGARE